MSITGGLLGCEPHVKDLGGLDGSLRSPNATSFQIATPALNQSNLPGRNWLGALSIGARHRWHCMASFPFINLSTALNRAQQFYGAERKGAAPLTVATSHWDYSPTSSGALQTVAALKNYGLMSDEGSGAARMVRLTDLALRIVLDDRPDSKDREEFIRQAALAPAVIQDIYTKFDGQLPSEPTLRHYLVLDRGFGPDTAAKAVKIVFENESLARLSRSSSLSQGAETEAELDTSMGSNLAIRDVEPVMMSGSGAMAARIRPAADLRLLGWDSESIALQFEVQPTRTTWEFIKQYAEMMLLRDKAKSENETEGKG